ncbi:pentatricopeptide repeat-containing protein [Pyrus ussuriensis x Pyrus communis]|uniref:Pentatricopeptide repeat-containing protein n=1 Tax=Pyrus ussuriensis x Pyrus communis TaxID=2448454 RepID=A0A5N5I303_9ROSA|nr:pentatricopeptide repeat-containing protein [Pyrus ussuriensis x Pyrus communis]
MQLHCQALACGPDTHPFVGTTLISMYAECGRVKFAQKVFEEMREPNVVAWNAILTSCFRFGDAKGAETMFGQMPLRNLTSWNILLAGYNGCFDEAFGFFRELQREGIRPNEASLTGVLSACAQAGAFEFGKILHCLVEKAGLLSMISVNNALLDTGNVDMARLVFKRMPEKSIISWTSMIAALAMHVLYACSHAGLVDEGCEYFSKMRDLYGIEPAIEHYGCIVDLYGRAGKLQKACDFVRELPISPNAVIWRTLRGACSIHGNVELAEQVKEVLSKLDPDNSGDYVLLSNVYAVAGKWKDVAALRRSMADQRIKKAPGWSAIEVDRVMLKLMVEGGYVLEVRSVLHDIEEEDKEDSVFRHSEKLAVAFGLARQREGRIIRIVKNLLSACFQKTLTVRASTTLKNSSKLPVGEKSSLPSQSLDINQKNDFVVFGGGHAATSTIRALKRGAVKPNAIAAVALTWAGPLPIVFGRDSSMYRLLRGTLQALAVGWMMYNMLVSNEKSIESQY